MTMNQLLSRIDYLEHSLAEAERLYEESEKGIEAICATRAKVRATQLFGAFLAGVLLSSICVILQMLH